MLAATEHGRSCAPTGLCAYRTLEDLLGLDHVMQGIPYVIGIGHTRKTGVDWGTFEPHPCRKQLIRIGGWRAIRLESSVGCSTTTRAPKRSSPVRGAMHCVRDWPS